MLNTVENKEALLEALDYEHHWNGLSTPMREGAQALSPEEKIEKIRGHFREIMETLGMDLNDESLAGHASSSGENVRERSVQGLESRQQAGDQAL